jgi:hypothetical protein
MANDWAMMIYIKTSMPKASTNKIKTNGEFRSHEVERSWPNVFSIIRNPFSSSSVTRIEYLIRSLDLRTLAGGSERSRLNQWTF